MVKAADQGRSTHPLITAITTRYSRARAMAETRAQLNRKVRKEALREQLAAQGHVQHVVDILEKLGNPASDVEAEMLERYKVVLNAKFKLISKYLGDDKSIEVTGDPEAPLLTGIAIEFISSNTDT